MNHYHVYPKINSLYKRFNKLDTYINKFGNKRVVDKHYRPLIIGDFACDEFECIKWWYLTEKIDGTNIRVIMDRVHSEGVVQFYGRNDDSDIPKPLLVYLKEKFTWEMMSEEFKDCDLVVLFGEGYGGKIQDGWYYSQKYLFCLFDVYVVKSSTRYWLRKDDVSEVALNLIVQEAPIIEPSRNWGKVQIVEYVSSRPNSILAMLNTGQFHETEGIVARAKPMMYFRDSGSPIMFKLKCKDFDNY